VQQDQFILLENALNPLATSTLRSRLVSAADRLADVRLLKSNSSQTAINLGRRMLHRQQALQITRISAHLSKVLLQV
jgi:hypothetical protein